jgi:hypothetical protein
MAQTTCTQCNAWYSSERELRVHLVTVHRIFGPEQSDSKLDDTDMEVAAVHRDQPVS